MSDGNLRQIFQKHLPEFHFQSVETGSTGRGIPDLNYCYGGNEGWIELKVTHANSVGIRAEQIAWAERRARAGGRVFLGVRQQCAEGPRKGKATDRLFLFSHADFRTVEENGLRKNEDRALFISTPTGPARWDWGAVKDILIQW